jgi:hypothetical protein
VGASDRELPLWRRIQASRRGKRRLAVVAGSLVIVPAVIATNAAMNSTEDGRANAADARGFGDGFFGVDPTDLGANGSLPDVDRLSEDLLRLAGNPSALARGIQPLDLPRGPLGIPGPALDAYMKAEKALRAKQPGCNLHWSLLASIGRIESNHARGGQVDVRGNTINPILGPVLNGAGFASIADTDGGLLDSNAQWDRAVGPMQFIPSTWSGYSADGNGDGVASPHNIYDATVAAGKYLCSGGLNLADPQQRAVAVFRYNHSDSYVRTVLIWADAYANGVTPLPAGSLDGIPALAAPPPLVELPPPAPPAPGPPPGPAPGPNPQPPVTSTQTLTPTPTPPPSSCPPPPPESSVPPATTSTQAPESTTSPTATSAQASEPPPSSTPPPSETPPPPASC